MSKIPKAKKSQMILVSMATGVVIAGLWFTLIQSQQASRVVVEKKTNDVRAKITKAEGMLKKADQIQTDLHEKAATLEKIEDSMASGDIYLWMINTMNDFNKTHRVTVADFQRETLGEVGIIPKFLYKAATFPIKGTGYFHDIGRFLADLENTFPYLRVQNLELTPGTKTPTTPDAEKLNFRFEVVALVKPSEQK